MIEFLLTLGLLAIVGFIVGVGVLLSKEYPKIAEFINRRPVIGWTVTFVAGGVACYFLAYLMMMFLLVLLGLFIH
jgi:hypothetical protein